MREEFFHDQELKDDKLRGEEQALAATARLARIVDANKILECETPVNIDGSIGLPKDIKSYIIHEDPKIYLIPNFLSDYEIDHLLELGEQAWTPSTVGFGQRNQQSTERTSYSCMLRSGQTPVVEVIENRLASLSGIPLRYLERLNMVRYSPGQFFNKHNDGCFRPMTVFLYLNDLPDGDNGETFFPELGLKVKPVKGCALMWSNIDAKRQEDQRTVHQGLPPKTVTKYGVNCFFNKKTMKIIVNPNLQGQSADLRKRLRACRQLKNWREYLLDELGFEASSLRGPEAETIKARAGFALTTLQALQQLPLAVPLETTVDGRCIIWLLGARDCAEKKQILEGGWSPLLAVLDVPVDFVLIGPELTPDPLVYKKPGVRLVCLSCSLHDAWVPKTLSPPTFVCCFNSGLGSSVAHLMLSWLPTLGRLLLMRCPVLLTCFGPQEALFEVWTLRALHANYQPHYACGFGTVKYGGSDSEKKVCMSNAMFSWVRGSFLPPSLLRESAIPHIQAQLGGVQLLEFLRASPTYLTILSDPERNSIPCWIELYYDLFLESVREALEMNMILRCTVEAFTSACRCKIAATVASDLGARSVLARFRRWLSRSAHKLSDDDLVKDLFSNLDEVERCLDIARTCAVTDVEDCNLCEAPEEKSLAVSFRVKDAVVELRELPTLRAKVISIIDAGEEVLVKGRRGLWLRATWTRQSVDVATGDGAEMQGWFLAYRRRRNPIGAAIAGVGVGGCGVGEVNGWKAADWDVFTNFIFS